MEWNNELQLILLLVEERETEREGGMIEEVDRLAVFRSYSQELNQYLLPFFWLDFFFGSGGRLSLSRRNKRSLTTG